MIFNIYINFKSQMSLPHINAKKLGLYGKMSSDEILKKIIDGNDKGIFTSECENVSGLLF